MQRRNHLLLASKFSAARIGTVFPLTREPHDNNACEHPEYHLKSHYRHKVDEVIIAASVNRAGSDTGKEKDESV